MVLESNSSSFESAISNNQDLHFDYLVNLFNSHNIDVTNKFKTLNIVNLDNMYTNLGLLLSDECPFFQ